MFYNIRNTTNFMKYFIVLLKNMKYICNVKQTKSVSLNNKKAATSKATYYISHWQM